MAIIINVKLYESERDKPVVHRSVVQQYADPVTLPIVTVPVAHFSIAPRFAAVTPDDVATTFCNLLLNLTVSTDLFSIMGHEISKDNLSVKKAPLSQKIRRSTSSAIFEFITIDRRSIDISDEEYADMKETIRQACKSMDCYCGF